MKQVTKFFSSREIHYKRRKTRVRNNNKSKNVIIHHNFFNHANQFLILFYLILLKITHSDTGSVWIDIYSFKQPNIHSAEISEIVKQTHIIFHKYYITIRIIIMPNNNYTSLLNKGPIWRRPLNNTGDPTLMQLHFTHQKLKLD